MDNTITDGGGPILDPSLGGTGGTQGPSGKPQFNPFNKDTVGGPQNSPARQYLDYITSNNPTLYLVVNNPKGYDGAGAVQIAGNIWLLPTPATAMVEAFNEMATDLQKSSLIMSLIMGASFMALGKLTRDDASYIEQSSKAQQAADITAAVAGGVTLIASISTGVMSFRGAKEYDLSDNEFHGLVTGVQSGVSAIGTIIEKGVQADTDVKKGNYDAMKVLIEGQQSMTNKMMDSQTDSKKTMEDVINQLMQTLPQLIKDLFTKHVLSLHG